MAWTPGDRWEGLCSPVAGPDSSTSLGIPVFSDTSGTVLADTPWTLSSASNRMRIPAGGSIEFVDSNTRIAESSDDLLIDADNDLVLAPDADVIVKAGATQYAVFDGTNQALNLGGASASQTLNVSGSARLDNDDKVEFGGTTTYVQGSSAAGGDLNLFATDDIVLSSSSNSWTINSKELHTPSSVQDETNPPRVQFGSSGNYYVQRENSSTTGNALIISSVGTTSDIVLRATGDIFLGDSASRPDILMVDTSAGRVGMGTTTPQYALDVVDNRTGAANYVAGFENAASAATKVIIKAEFSGDSVLSTTDRWIAFLNSGGRIGSIRGNNDATTVVYAQFAGHHSAYCLGTVVEEGSLRDGMRSWRRGMVLRSTGRRCSDGTRRREEPEVELASQPDDPTVVGVFQGFDSDGSEYVGLRPDLPVIDYAAVGHALILVTDEAGEVRNGDLVTTSGTHVGYARRQDDDVIRACTVAKVVEQIDWAEQGEAIGENRAALVACFVYCG